MINSFMHLNSENLHQNNFLIKNRLSHEKYQKKTITKTKIETGTSIMFQRTIFWSFLKMDLVFVAFLRKVEKQMQKFHLEVNHQITGSMAMLNGKIK